MKSFAALLAGLVGGLALSGPAPAPEPAPPPGTYSWDIPQRGLKTAYVLRVHDGDTLEAGLLVPVVIRLDGINAPELRAAGGPASRDALAGQVLNKLVTLDLRGREKYGRTLARVWTVAPAPADVNRWMVEQSFAVPYSGGPR